jgi:hypothetical protein
MGVQASRSYYDAQSQRVNLTEITSSDPNAKILRRLRNNDPELARLSIIQHDDDAFGRLVIFEHWIRMSGVDMQHESAACTFVVGDGDDLGWLGYFVGRNTKLRSLRINDLPGYREQITALFRGIEQNRSITELCIDVDRLGESVLSSLSALLQSESCSLTSLQLESIPLGDDAAAALADALKGNKSLKSFTFNLPNLTPAGWSAFSKLLCDTSSVNNTNLSNHSLERLGNLSLRNEGVPGDVRQLLAFNKLTLTDKHAAAIKILKFHPDFDVEPFFEWNLKALPLVLSWFERARGMSAESEEEIQKRQLSTMYNFVRGMPLEAIDGYRRYSSRKKRKSDLLGRIFHTLVLLCLLTLVLPLI